MIKLGINEIELANVLKDFELDKAEMQKACTTALNKTAEYIAAKAIKEISSKTKIPQKIVKGRVGKFIKSALSVKIWNGLNPVNLIRFLTSDKAYSRSFKKYIEGKGVKVGKYAVEGAFFAYGGTRIVQRVGKERFPVKNVVVAIEIEEAAIIEAIINSEYEERLFKELQRAYRWEIVRKS